MQSNQTALIPTSVPAAEPLRLTQDEILAEIDHIARTRLGMSGFQLLELDRSGCLCDPACVRDALDLASQLDDAHAE